LSYVAEQSFTQAARLTGLSISSLMRLFDKRRMPIRRQLPRVIAVDEFKGDANKTKFQTIIVDVEKKEIIEVLPDRRVETLEKYFKSCDSSRVEIVVMDMSKTFKKAVQSVFDKPFIIADRFPFHAASILGIRRCTKGCTEIV
jgi:transposase